MTGQQPTAELDTRFSDPDSGPTSWQEAVTVLDGAELYWLTTVRADGRPHVTPLIGVWQDGAVHFCTGLREQKARNLEHHQQVALTTGSNSWARGTDVVVEGTADRLTDRTTLQRLADAYEAKYGSDWHLTLATASSDRGTPPPRCFELNRSKCSRSPSNHTPRRPSGSRRADGPD
jgi:general stress protein 26